MKRQIIKITAVVAILVGLIVSCSQPNTDSLSDGENTFISGWWKFASSIEGGTTTFIKYDSDKSILRAGTSKEEYSSGYLNDKVKAGLDFDLLKDSSLFTKISDSLLLPSWATNETIKDPSDSENKCNIYFIENFPYPDNIISGYTYLYINDIFNYKKGSFPTTLTVTQNSFVNLSAYTGDYDCEVNVIFATQKEINYFYELDSLNTKPDGSGDSYKYNNASTNTDLHITEDIWLYGIWKPSTRHDSTLVGKWTNDYMIANYPGQHAIEFYPDGSMFFCIFIEGQFKAVLNDVGRWETSIQNDGTKIITILIGSNHSLVDQVYNLSNDSSILTTTATTGQLYWNSPTNASWTRVQ